MNMCIFFVSAHVSFHTCPRALLFSILELDESRRSPHCLRMKNQVNLGQTVILHADENPGDAGFSTMMPPNVIKTDQ